MRGVDLKRMTIACAALLLGCSEKKPAAAPADVAKFNTDLPMTELMAHVVDPASFAYWKGSGTEVTEKGARDLSPTTDEGWETLESGAASLIEAGNMLQLPGRARAPVADWNRYAQALTARAVEAKAAAERKDKNAVYVDGAQIYQVCTDCHHEYVIEPMLKAQGGPPAGTLPPWPQDTPKPRAP